MTTIVADIPTPPSRLYAARVVTEWDMVAQPDLGTVRCLEAFEPLFPCQSREVGRWGDGKSLVEFTTLLAPNATQMTLQDDFVAGGPLPIVPGHFFNKGLVDLLTVANKIRVRWQNALGVTETLSLSARPVLKKVRYGRYAIKYAYHATTTNFGGLHYWFELSAFDRRLFLTMNWHNGIPRSDVLFTSMQLLLPAGYRWKPVIPEDTAYNVPTNELIRSSDPNTGQSIFHILGQRCERPFRVVIYPEEANPTVLYDDGLGYVKSGKRFGPAALTMPTLTHIGTLLSSEQTSLANEQSWLAALINDPNWGTSAPLNFAWPAKGTTYGGTSGGTEIDWFHGDRWLGSGSWEGLMHAYINQLRWRSRPTGAIYCDVVNGVVVNKGIPVIPENCMVGGYAPWALDTFRRFLVQGGIKRDAPWNFKAYPRPGGQISYDQSLENGSFTGGWDPVDDQHYIRSMRDNIALACTAADDLAILYLTVDAELGRMAAWHLPGQWRTMFDVVTPDIGVGWGRGQGWTQWLTAASALFNFDTPRYQKLKAYATMFALNREKAQMPNGLILASNADGKAQNMPPFGDGSGAPDYWVAQCFEEQICMLGMWATFKVFGEFAFPGGRTSALIAQDLCRGLRDLAWHTDADGQSITGTDDTGPWKRYPLGPNIPPGSSTRYATRANFSPLNVCVVDPEGDPGYDNNNEPYYVAAYLWVGFVSGRDVLLDINRWCGVSGQTLAQLKTIIQGYNFDAGSARANSKLETFLGLLTIA